MFDSSSVLCEIAELVIMPTAQIFTPCYQGDSNNVGNPYRKDIQMSKTKIKKVTKKPLTKQVDILQPVQLIAASCGLYEPKDGYINVKIWLEPMGTYTDKKHGKMPVYLHKYSIKKGGK